MTKSTEAIYANGVLRPREPLPLREQERVRITVESGESVRANGSAVQEARRRLIAGFDKLRLHTDGRTPSRVDLRESRQAAS